MVQVVVQAMVQPMVLVGLSRVKPRLIPSIRPVTSSNICLI